MLPKYRAVADMKPVTWGEGWTKRQ